MMDGQVVWGVCGYYSMKSIFNVCGSQIYIPSILFQSKFHIKKLEIYLETKIGFAFNFFLFLPEIFVPGYYCKQLNSNHFMFS